MTLSLVAAMKMISIAWAVRRSNECQFLLQQSHPQQPQQQPIKKMFDGEIFVICSARTMPKIMYSDTSPVNTISGNYRARRGSGSERDREKDRDRERERSTQKENHRNLLIVNNNVDDK